MAAWSGWCVPGLACWTRGLAFRHGLRLRRGAVPLARSGTDVSTAHTDAAQGSLLLRSTATLCQRNVLPTASSPVTMHAGRVSDLSATGGDIPRLNPGDAAGRHVPCDHVPPQRAGRARDAGGWLAVLWRGYLGPSEVGSSWIA